MKVNDISYTALS